MEKSEILEVLKKIIAEKIENFENLIAQIRHSNQDTKSSMGDKYETGREMLQQEINHLQIQLNEVLKQKDALSAIKTKVSVKAEKGALVKTEKGMFFISIPLGNIYFNSQKIFCISPLSPLATAMNAKQKGENFTLNNTNYSILEII